MLRQGAILAIPTDSSYALVCHLDDRPAVERLRRIRQINDKHHLTLLCRDLSELSSYARVDNRQYRLRSEEHTSELQSPCNLVCRLLLEKKKQSILTHANELQPCIYEPCP